MSVLAVVAFILSWTPYYVTVFVSLGFGDSSLPLAVHLVTDILTKSSVMYNPIIFTATNAGFRITLLHKVICRNAVGPATERYENSQQTTQDGRQEVEVVPIPTTSHESSPREALYG